MHLKILFFMLSFSKISIDRKKNDSDRGRLMYVYLYKNT